MRPSATNFALTKSNEKWESMMNVKIDGIKRDMGVFNDGLKAHMEEMMNVKIEGLKEGLEKLVDERNPSGDRAIHENHDEDKRNINYYFRDSNVGFKNHHIPKINMRKIDGKDLVTWILHMEQYFDLHDVQPPQKVCISYLYLELNQFVWYRWICSRKPLVTWSIFIRK